MKEDIPINLEKLLAIAAVDEELEQLLFMNREAAIGRSGLPFTRTERNVLLAINQTALKRMVHHVRQRIPDEDRRIFLKTAAAAALLAFTGGGVLQAGCPGPCTGAQPDPPPSNRVAQTRQPEPAQPIVPEPEKEKTD